MPPFNPIWNAEERRPKAIFRLCIQFLILMFLNLLAAFPISAAPLSGFNSIYSPLISLGSLAGILVSVWLAGRFLDHRGFSDYGFRISRSWWYDLVFGLLLGAILISLIFLIELSLGWVVITDVISKETNQPKFLTALLSSIILFISVGIQEETFSRGYQLRNIAEGLHRPQISPKHALLIAWVMSSILFGLLHAANPHASIASTCNITIAGLLLGLGFILSGELAIPIGFHITWNFFQGPVFGFPVSGLAPIASLLKINQYGPVIMTGGEFGPEAGVLGLLAILIGCGAILGWFRLTHRPVKLQSDLAVYSAQS